MSERGKGGVPGDVCDRGACLMIPRKVLAVPGYRLNAGSGFPRHERRSRVRDSSPAETGENLKKRKRPMGLFPESIYGWKKHLHKRKSELRFLLNSFAFDIPYICAVRIYAIFLTASATKM